MVSKRLHAAALPLLALLLSVFSRQVLSAPEPNAVLEATGEGLTYLTVELRPKGGKELLRSEFKGTEGSVIGGIALPDGSGSTYEITAFNADGKPTHSGKGSVPPFVDGDKPLQLVLPPTDKERGPDVLVVSLSHQRLVLEAKALEEPNNYSIRAQAFDPRGNSVKLDPNEIRWGITDPNHFEIIPLKDRFEAVLRPVDGWTRPFELDLCNIPAKVIVCTSAYCKATRVCTEPWTAISAGGTHTCALTASGVAYCWGSNDDGELGAPTPANGSACQPTFSATCSTLPLQVVCPAGSPCRFTQISSGKGSTVAIDTKGDAWWWGAGSAIHRKVTATFAGAPVTFSKVAAGTGHGCGVAWSGTLFCWGSNRFGEAGAPLPMTSVSHTSPVQVLSPMKFKTVVAGGEHTCAIGSAGQDVVCFGRDDRNESSGPRSTPYPANAPRFFFQQFGGLTTILDVTASTGSTCATVGNGVGVQCWGRASSLTVSPFGAPDAVTVGGLFACALSGQQASCVGDNTGGQLGINSMMFQSFPVAVLTPPAKLASITTGDSHTCGLTPEGDAYCWGQNLSGQIGMGSFNGGILVPTKIPVP